MDYQYRYLARDALARAKKLIASGDSDNLTYACLELRKCLEALAYDQLLAYLAEVPLKALATWQPDKVIKELLRVDPRADASSQLSMQREAGDGQPAEPWVYIGEDRRLKADRIAKMYPQLGSFLHVPTIKQSQANKKVEEADIRSRIEKMIDELDHVLSGSIFNVSFGVSVTFQCVCESPIRRRDKFLKSGEIIECGNCGQHFHAEPSPDAREYEFIPTAFLWNCQACGVERRIYDSAAKEGLDVSCPECGDVAHLKFAQKWVFVRKADEKAARSDEGEAPKT
jgi:ribosomal protein S27E